MINTKLYWTHWRGRSTPNLEPLTTSTILTKSSPKLLQAHTTTTIWLLTMAISYLSWYSSHYHILMTKPEWSLLLKVILKLEIQTENVYFCKMNDWLFNRYFLFIFFVTFNFFITIYKYLFYFFCVHLFLFRLVDFFYSWQILKNKNIIFFVFKIFYLTSHQASLA